MLVSFPFEAKEGEGDNRDFLNQGRSSYKREKWCSHTPKGTRRAWPLLGTAKLTLTMQSLQFNGLGISYGMIVYAHLRVRICIWDNQTSKLNCAMGLDLDPNYKMPEASLLY